MSDPNIVAGGGSAPSNGMAVAALVTGIAGLALSVLCGWIPFINILPLLVSIVGVILGILGMKKPTGKGMAVAGLICAAIGLLITIILIALWVMAFAAIGAAGAAAAGAAY